MNPDEDMELRENIWKLALLNAVRHDGQAHKGPVIGKLLDQRPELKTKARNIARFVDGVVKEVNNLTSNEQKRIVENRWPEAIEKEKVEENKQLPPLANVDRYSKVITRFSPNPDCVLHLGSARALVLDFEYARMYRGMFILRFEDTDPKSKKPVLEFYDRIREDLAWLGCRPDTEYIQSDRISTYYKYAEKLLKESNAYICVCRRHKFREKSLARKPCQCRNFSSDEHLKRWRGMLGGKYKEGEAVVRIKTDLDHPNPAVRDWPALRIIDISENPHPRVGTRFHVWPLYNFACGIDDHLMGVTHIIRGKEHLTNMVRQKYMYRHLGWQYPEAIHYGRLKITGASLSKSEIIDGMMKGLYESWEDPRLATFAALRRRGIMPEAIRKMILDIGPKTSDVTLSWKNLYAYNRRILDPLADRYFFVQDPMQIRVKGIPKTFLIRLRLHPDFAERGSREYTVKPSGKDNSSILWISKSDAKELKVGMVTRLMELFNIDIDDVSTLSIDASFRSLSYKDAKKNGAHLIHWIPVRESMPCQVVMPDADKAEGIAESACKKLKPNEIVQFERFGFARIDKVNMKLIAYYAHR